MNPNYGKRTNYREQSVYDASSSKIRESVVLPFLEAVKGENLMIIRHYLSDSHSNINQVDLERNSCLHIASSVYLYDLDIFKELLKHGADVNATNFENNTPLHLALKTSPWDIELIQVLLDRGANPNAKNMSGDTPLHLFLRSSLQQWNKDKPLTIIKLLIQNGAHPSFENKRGITPFIMALNPAYCDESAYIVAVGLNVLSASNKSLLSCSANNLNVIKLFLECDPFLAIHKGYGGRTALHVAISEGASSDVVKELIKVGAKVNARDFLKNTPLHRTKLSNYSGIETLVKYGAEIDAVNLCGNTPLLEALKSECNVTVVTALIELGANLEVKDIRNKSPLYYAMINRFVPLGVIKLLIEKGNENILLEIQKVIEDYDLFRSELIHKVCLQYFLFYKMFTKHIMYHDPESFISFDKYDPTMGDVLSNFRDKCLIELFNMKYDRLQNGKDLFSYVRQNIGVIDYENTYPASTVKEVLVRIHNKKYPNCIDLLQSCLNRHRLLNYLPFLSIYSCVQENTNSKKSVVLDYFSLMSLVRFLDRETLLCLVEAFIDFPCCKDTSSCGTGFLKFSTKRKFDLCTS